MKRIAKLIGAVLAAVFSVLLLMKARASRSKQLSESVKASQDRQRAELKKAEQHSNNALISNRKANEALDNARSTIEALSNDGFTRMSDTVRRINERLRGTE